MERGLVTDVRALVSGDNQVAFTANERLFFSVFTVICLSTEMISG